MKKNNTDFELLSAYVDGELSTAEKKYIEEKIVEVPRIVDRIK